METKNLGDLEKSIKDVYASLGAKEAVIRLNQIRDNDDHNWDTYDKICFDIAIAELEDAMGKISERRKLALRRRWWQLDEA